MKDIIDPITILLVEDDEGHARLTEKNLRRSGIENPIKHFDSGKKILDFLFVEQTHPEDERYLILLDLNLPEIDGYEVLKRIKSDPLLHVIPVVILTTTSNPGETSRCYALGCNLYITKSVNYDEFCDTMQKLGLLLSIVKFPLPNR